MALKLHLHTPSGRIRTIDLAYQAKTLPLVDRLLARVRVRDEEMGHEFHGNQYTDVPGTPKPTSAKATTSKAAVHELLSTGHQFTFEELMKATGAKSALSLQTAISDLKNPKYAGPTGALQILKLKSGHFYVGKAAQPVAAAAKPAPAASPTPGLLSPSEHDSLVAKVVVKAPATKMSYEEATKAYEAEMAAVFEHVGSLASDVFTLGLNHTTAAKYFKTAKAKAMAQFAANTKGVDQVPHKVEVFETDEDFAYELAKADFMKPELKAAAQKKAYAEWKDATAKAKNAYAEWKDATAKAKNAPKAAPAPTTPEAKPTVVKADPAKPSHQLPAGGHQPHFPAIPNYVPHDHAGIKKEDFQAGAFSAGMGHAKELFTKHSLSDASNKARIQKDLEERLTASPAFQAISKAMSAAKKQYGSLAATLVSTWASTSGDTHPVAVASQLSVRDAFDMDHQHLSTGNMSGMHTGTHQDDEVFKQAASTLGVPYQTDEQKLTFRAGMRDFALAQYHNTQAWFKDKGIKHLYLARGMKEAPTSKAKLGKLKLQPASSFTTNYGTAKQFAGGGNVYMVKVPVEQVMGSYLTGFGCTHEHEVVVLAHKELDAVKLPGKHDSLVSATAHVKEAFGYGASVTHTVSSGSQLHQAQAAQGVPLKPAKAGVPQAQMITAWTKKLQNAANIGHEEFLVVKAQFAKHKAEHGINLPQATKYANILATHFKAATPAYTPSGPKKITGLPETTMKNGTVTTAKQAAWAGDLKKLKQLQDEYKYEYGITSKAIKLYLGKLVVHLEKKGITE